MNGRILLLLLCLATLATFLTLAQHRAKAIRLRVERRRADDPRGLPHALSAQGASRHSRRVP